MIILNDVPPSRNKSSHPEGSSRTKNTCGHALDDRPVPIENSRMLYQALQEKKITAKLLELPSGGHGLNGYQGPMWDQWKAEAIEWIDSL